MSEERKGTGSVIRYALLAALAAIILVFSLQALGGILTQKLPDNEVKLMKTSGSEMHGDLSQYFTASP